MRFRREKLLAPRVRDLAFVTQMATSLEERRDLQLKWTGKLAMLVELLQDPARIPTGDKVVIFTLIKEALPVLQRALMSAGVACFDGTKHSKRSVASFCSSTDGALLLQAGDGVSGTGSAGLDLPFAKHVVLLDIVRQDVEEQCIKRVRRIGQQHATTVWKIRTEGSVDGPPDAPLARHFSAESIPPSLFDEAATLAKARLTQLVRASNACKRKPSGSEQSGGKRARASR